MPIDANYDYQIGDVVELDDVILEDPYYNHIENFFPEIAGKPLPNPGDRGTLIHCEFRDNEGDLWDVQLDKGYVLPLFEWEFELVRTPVNDPSQYDAPLL